LKNKAFGFLVSFVAIVIAAIVGFGQAHAQSAPAAKTKASDAPAANMKLVIPDIPYTKFVLANGLTVLVHEDHKTPVVALNTWYHVAENCAANFAMVMLRWLP
jgi:zinc protease